MNASKFAVNFYIDYFNNYITVDKIAEHYKISKEFAEAIIKEGKALYESGKW